MNISIEPAAVSDAEALSRLAAATFALACPPGTPQRDIDSYIDSELQPRHFLDHPGGLRLRQLISPGQRAFAHVNANGLRGAKLLCMRQTYR